MLLPAVIVIVSASAPPKTTLLPEPSVIVSCDPIVGAIVYYRLDDYTRGLPDESWLPGSVRDFLLGRPNLATIVFAVVLVGLMFVSPDGIVGFAKRIARRFVRITRAPAGVPPPADAPSDPFSASSAVAVASGSDTGATPAPPGT